MMTDEAAGAVSKPIYKYVDIAGLRRLLQGSIRFTQPSAFNDPFELMCGRNAGSRRRAL